jgi:RND family efflux transporter MFP subunit
MEMSKSMLPGKASKFIKSKWTVLLLILLIMIVIPMIFAGAFGKTDTGAKISTQPVRQGAIKIDFVGDGQISLPLKNLDFEVQGKIINIWVKPGQAVKKGDKLAEIDAQTYEEALQKAEIEYKKAEAGLFNVAQQTGLNLLLNNKQIDIALIGSALSGAQSYQVAKLNLDAAKSSLTAARDKLAQKVLVAPTDGKIISIAKTMGDTTGGGMSATSSGSSDTSVPDKGFIVFLDSDKAYVDSNITESDINNIFMGQEVEVTVDAADGGYIPGKVVKIDGVPQVDSNNVVTYKVTAELAENQDLIREGMTAVISFIINQKDNVLIIPNRAVQTEDGRQYVEVKNKDGQIVKKSIRTGLSDGENVELVSGLKRGESVVVRGSQA